MGFLDYRITYKLAPTPEGEEHPNIERVDLRKPLTEEIEKIIHDNTDSDGICCADDLLAAIRAWNLVNLGELFMEHKHPRTMQEAFGPYTNDYIYDDDPAHPWLFWLVVGVTVLWAILIVWLLVC